MSDRPRKPRRKTKLQPKRLDTTTRELLADNPPAWVAYMRLHAGGLMQVMDSNVASTAAEIDQVYRVTKPRPHLIHIEVQARWDNTLARRMWRYNALLDLKYDLRVRSVALLLRPTARLQANDRRARPPSSRRRSGGRVSLLGRPRLATARRAAADGAPGHLAHGDPGGRACRRPARHPPSDRFQAHGGDLARKCRYNDGEDALPGRNANGSRTRQGLEKGASDNEHSQGILILSALLRRGEKGEKRGHIAEAKKIVIDLGQERFGRLGKATRAKIESIDDLERLEALIKKTQKVASWAELLTDVE